MAKVLRALRRVLMPPSIRRLVDMNALITGGWMTQAVYVIAKLGVADALKNGPRDVGEIAEIVGADPDSLYRVLRALDETGVVRETAPRRFALTPLGALLLSDVRPSLRAWAVYAGEPWHWQCWGDLLGSVRSGTTAVERRFGVRSWYYLETNPDAADVFDAAMADLATVGDVTLVSSYNFSRFRTIVDVGGGNGALLISLLRVNPRALGTLYETQLVIDRTRRGIAQAGLETRCRLEAGDFFENVPPRGDLYLLKQVLHDWQDDGAEKILRNCRAAMAGGARLLVIEIMLPEFGRPSLAKLTDLEMLVMTGGRERSLAEYRTLLESAGLKILKVHPTRSPFSIIEAAPK